MYNLWKDLYYFSPKIYIIYAKITYKIMNKLVVVTALMLLNQTGTQKQTQRA
jgi:hypothetical protein